MASSFPLDPSEHTLHDSPPSPPPLQSHASVLDDLCPPSPDGISAAAILATLSDSRPPTSHGEDAEGLEEDDDDESGGISLVDNGHDVFAPHPLAMAAPTIPAAFADLLHPSSTQSTWDFDYTSAYAALDQHAAAMASLSMEQLIPPTASSSMPSTTPMYSVHIQNAAPSNEDVMYIHDVSAFVELPAFLDYAAPPKEPSAGLDIAEQLEMIIQRDLWGEDCDFQGINWEKRRSSRASFRVKRAGFEGSRMLPKVRSVRKVHTRTPNTESYFAFRKMSTRHTAAYPHFQLRNLLAATSRNDIFYATEAGVLRTNASGSPPTPVVDVRRRKFNGNNCQITTLAAAGNVLIAGGLEGEYHIANLSSTYGTSPTTGHIKDWAPETKSYITNHVHLFDSRITYTPQAALCSNDGRLRVLDCETNTFVHSFTYPTAVNCSATSPNGRMRVVVGDFHEALITNAETGQPIETLQGHKEDVFACAWADDGVHVATAAQDSTIMVWDARYWRDPLTILSELTIPRVLRFSPVGSGPRVLVAAEADDYVNIINAQTFESKQVFDFFGPTAGVSMTPDGQSLFIANAEKTYGGIIELERTGWGEARGRKGRPVPWDADEETVDWESDSELDTDHRIPCSWQERERRGLNLGDLVV